ncbi:MAG: hypothetical protein RB294_06455 [Bacteroidales bacterium]|jgi:hypothetical protein|nr:hypothetical protein [Bacteroidales bacterium]
MLSKISNLGKVVTAQLIFLVSAVYVQAQVGIATTSITPHASAMLEVRAANMGILIPNVALTGTTDAITVASPATSLFVYNTATVSDVTPGFYYWDGSKWVRFLTGASSDDWKLAGNAGTTAGTHFLGTTDAVDMVFKTNAVEQMRILSGGNVGIGTAAPTNKLHVDGLGTTTAIYGQYDANRNAYMASSSRGVSASMNTGAASGYGGYFSHTNSSSSGYGIYAETNFTGTTNPSWTYGARIISNSTTQDQYGIYNTANHTGTTGYVRGFYNDVDIAAANTSLIYGIYNIVSRGDNGGVNYGIYSTANNGSSVYGLYASASGGTTNWAGYFAGGNVYITNNLGIASAAPTEKLDVTGNIRFSGALMPGNDPGTSGKVLKSNGAAVAPTWISAVTPDNIYTVESTAALEITSSTFTVIPGESITVNGLNPGDRVLIWFGGNMYMDGADYNIVDVALHINGTMAVVGGFVRTAIDWDYAELSWQNYSAIARYNVTVAGDYTFDVRARATLGVSESIFIGGDATQAAESVLQVFVLRN